MSRPAGDGPPGPADTFLYLWSEMLPGRGEDALPIAKATGPFGGAVAAFDGLGGSGGMVVNTPTGEQSQARVAARAAHDAVAAFLDGIGPKVAPDLPAVAILASYLCPALAAVVENLNLGGGRLRSKMIRTLPTTLALARYERNGATVCVEVIWAGDSRVYLVSPADGMRLLTEDDLRSGGDALANLTDDSPMSNLVSASGPFVLNRRVIEIRADVPVLLLAATDGCFGYVPTPWHFEHLLLTALRASGGYEEWRVLVDQRIRAVAGDDASMGIAVLGPGSYDHLVREFGNRIDTIASIVGIYDDRQREVADLRQRLGDAENALGDLRTAQWRTYRDSFEHWLRAAAKEGGASYTVSGWSGRAVRTDPREAVPAAAPTAAPTTAPTAAPGEHRCPTCGTPHGSDPRRPT